MYALNEMEVAYLSAGDAQSASKKQLDFGGGKVTECTGLLWGSTSHCVFFVRIVAE